MSEFRFFSNSKATDFRNSRFIYNGSQTLWRNSRTLACKILVQAQAGFLKRVLDSHNIFIKGVCSIMSGMLRIAGVTAVIGLLASTATTTVQADEVLRKYGEKSVRGDVTAITREAVSVKSLAKVVEIPANEISSIKWDAQPAKLNMAHSNAQRGQYDTALKLFQEAQEDAKSPSDNLKTDINYGQVAMLGELALNRGDEIDDAIAGLEKFREDHPQSYHYYSSLELSARLALQKQDLKTAQELYEQLGKSSLKEYQMAAKVGEGRILLSRDGGEATAALQEFESVLAMQAASPGEKEQQAAAMNGKVSCLILEKKFEEALAILDGIVADPEVTDETVLAQAYVLQGRCHMAAGRAKSAILSFLYVDTLLPSDGASHAEALFHLVQLWPQVGKQVRAQNARGRLQSQYPQSRWAKQLNDL